VTPNTLSHARVVVDSGMSGPGGTCDTARRGLTVGEADGGVWRTRGTEGVQAAVVKDASASGVREPAAPAGRGDVPAGRKALRRGAVRPLVATSLPSVHLSQLSMWRQK
jgi:hypothetical protein